MLKNIKSNLSASNVIQNDDLSTKIYITIKSFFIILSEYNHFFITQKKEFALSNKIYINIKDNKEIQFFDDEENLICNYSSQEKNILFNKYYQTEAIERKMAEFILIKLPILGKNLKLEMEKEIQRRQNKLLSVLEEKEEKPKNEVKKIVQKEQNSHESLTQTTDIQIPTKHLNELVFDIDIDILS